MTAARILVFTAGPLCRNPRVLKEAATLATAGHEVTVLTVARHPRYEAFDDELLRHLPFRKIALDRRPRRASARAASFIERGLAAALRRGGMQHPAALGPYHALLRRARAIPFDLAIAHTELPLCIARRLLAEGRPVAADFEDWHSRDLLPEHRRGRPLRLLADTERHLLRHARHASTTSRALADALATDAAAPTPVVIHNTFPLSIPPATPHPDSGYTPAFFWFSQTIGPGRGLEAFLAAWSKTTRPSRVVLLGENSPGYAETLLASLPASRRESVSLHPLVAPGELPAIAARHDIGLALEHAEPPSRALTITNKVFQYLDAGLALLATPTPGQREVFAASPGIGLLDDLSDANALARRLDQLLGDPARLAVMRGAARAAAEQRWCWEHTAPVLLDTVRRSLSTPISSR